MNSAIVDLILKVYVQCSCLLEIWQSYVLFQYPIMCKGSDTNTVFFSWLDDLGEPWLCKVKFLLPEYINLNVSCFMTSKKEKLAGYFHEYKSKEIAVL